MNLDAVVLAGGEMAPDDPLRYENQDGRRSLITIHGKPMVQWVINALASSDLVRDIYIVGLTDDSGVTASKSLYFLPNTGSMFENVRSGVLQSAKDHPSQSKVIIASADIPALQPEMVNWVANQVFQDPTPHVYYNVITRKVMEEKFPEAKRSFVYFKDMAVCGGDLNVVDKSFFTNEKPIWKKLTEARKHPLKQASLLGFDTLFLVALRLITLEQTVRRICNKLSIEGRALVCPFAEVAMDADKPHQLDILRDALDKNS